MEILFGRRAEHPTSLDKSLDRRVSTPGWWGGIPSHSPASVLSISCHRKGNFVTVRSQEFIIRLTSGWMHSNSTRVVHGVGRVSGEQIIETVKCRLDYFGRVSETVAELQFHTRPKVIPLPFHNFSHFLTGNTPYAMHYPCTIRMHPTRGQSYDKFVRSHRHKFFPRQCFFNSPLFDLYGY